VTGGLIDEGNIEEGGELGDGSFGVVKEGIWKNGSKRIKGNNVRYTSI